MAPLTIEKFLREIVRIIQERNGAQLQDLLIIEPPLPPLYTQIVHELRGAYPPASQTSLEQKCKEFIPEYEEGDDSGSRSTFITFMVKYFSFLRDVDVNNLIETHDMLKTLLKSVTPSPYFTSRLTHLQPMHSRPRLLHGLGGSPNGHLLLSHPRQTGNRSRQATRSCSSPDPEKPKHRQRRSNRASHPSRELR